MGGRFHKGTFLPLFLQFGWGTKEGEGLKATSTITTRGAPTRKKEKGANMEKTQKSDERRGGRKATRLDSFLPLFLPHRKTKQETHRYESSKYS